MSDVVWMYLPTGGVSHALPQPETTRAVCGTTGSESSWEAKGAGALARCRRCVKALTKPFMPTEDELSDEARAILAHARRTGEPFTRVEVAEVAPGSQWDVWSRYPKTLAVLDPIRELVSAGMVTEYDEVPLKTNPTRAYKRWSLTEHVSTLAELLDAFAEALGAWHAGGGSVEQTGAVRDEILRRFGR